MGHPESGVLDAPSDTVEYCGPYWQPRHLVRDLRRLNLFRHAEIHCIGLGEASESLLREIASVGLGKVRILGKGGE